MLRRRSRLRWLFSVFLIANDSISHSFWHYYEPDKYKGVDLAEAARLGEAIPNIARHNDRFLGEVLDRLDDDTVASSSDRRQGNR